MSQNQPFSRLELQQLKAKTDEETRLNQINQIIRDIYSKVINQAKTKTNTSYNYEIGQGCQMYNNNHPIFSEKNKDDFINGLKILFPDCAINYKMLSRGNDGQLHDITNIDEKMRPFINKQQVQTHIVIDWS
jgi:hypothetical protein